MIKKILITALVLAAVFGFAVPYFLPSEFKVEREIVIDAPREAVFHKIANLQVWKSWSPWYAREPDATMEFEGTPGVVGSQLYWKGETIGSGRQTLAKVVEPEYIEFQLEFLEPNTSQALAYWQLQAPAENRTRVLWGLKGELGYPLERYMGLFMDKMVGQDFEDGLQRLKDLSEHSQ